MFKLVEPDDLRRASALLYLMSRTYIETQVDVSLLRVRWLPHLGSTDRERDVRTYIFVAKKIRS